MEYKIVILDDHPILSKSLEMIINAILPDSNVDFYMSLEGFMADVAVGHWHLAIVDLSLGDGDGRDAIKAIKKANTTTKIIAFSSHDNPKIIQSTLRVGADTYLLKSTDAPQIMECIKTLMIDDEEYLSPGVQKILTDFMKGKRLTNHQFPDLTDRELQVLTLISEENTSKEIGNILFLSEFTVEGHRATLFNKFDVKNLAGLIKKAFYAGYLN